jgi:hypothetical protein
VHNVRRHFTDLFTPAELDTFAALNERVLHHLPRNPLPASPRSRTERPDRTTQQEPGSGHAARTVSQRSSAHSGRARQARDACVRGPRRACPRIKMRLAWIHIVKWADNACSASDSCFGWPGRRWTRASRVRRSAQPRTAYAPVSGMHVPQPGG